MIDRDHGLSLSRQAKALGISRGSVYYPPRPTSDTDLALMRRIDELHLEYPFAGRRMLKNLLRAEGYLCFEPVDLAGECSQLSGKAMQRRAGVKG